MNRSQTLTAAIVIIIATTFTFVIWTVITHDETDHQPRVKTIDGVECVVSGSDNSPEIHSCEWETSTTWAG